MSNCQQCSDFIVVETGEILIYAESCLTIGFNNVEIYIGGKSLNNDLVFCNLICFATWLENRALKFKESKINVTTSKRFSNR